MENYLSYLIPVLAMAFLAAGWMLVQLLAMKMNTKNHIENRSGCCGACTTGEKCNEKTQTTTTKDP